MLSGVTSDGKLKFTAIPLHQLRQYWPQILPGITQIKDCNNEPWMVEDIYAALVGNKATLYVMHAEDGHLAGFAVYEVVVMPFDAAPSLNIWLGWSADKGQGQYGVEVSKQVAQAAGIERILFWTPQDSPWVKNFRRVTSLYEV